MWASVDRVGEAVKENMKVSAKESLDCYELKLPELWFDEEHSELCVNEIIWNH
jgi:hypothetical protein